MKKEYLMYLMSIVVVAMLSVGFVSCSDDDDDGESIASLSESQIKLYLESGSGTWDISEKDDGDILKSTWIFKEGKIYDDHVSLDKGATYSVVGGFLKLVSYPSWDFLDGGYVITKINDMTMKGYWQGNKSNSFTGTKR